MNILHGIINPLAQLATGSTITGSKANDVSAGTAPATPASSTLDANSFITLLTTELQAQDPLNPLDPTQFVSQLTDLNSLQQLIQIRTDLDSLAGAVSGGSTTGGTGSGATGSVVGQTPASATSARSVSPSQSEFLNLASRMKVPNGTPSANSLSALQSVLGSSASAASSSAAALYSKLGSISQLF